MSNETETKNKLVVFLDNIGRTILAERVLTNDAAGVVRVKNPVILHVLPDNQGRMSVQLLPIFFREFLADREGDAVFNYKTSNVTESEIDNLDYRLQAQYSQLFGKGNMFVPPNAGGIVAPDGSPAQAAPAPTNKVVNLFEE